MDHVALPLTIRDLTVDDLSNLSDSPSKLASMRTELARATRGEVAYLVICAPNNHPLAYGAADFTKPAGGATIYQLTVPDPLQSCGLGTHLIHALESRIQARAIPFAELGIDDNADRSPRPLYERLGYTVSGTEQGSWTIDTPTGPAPYETTITLFRKPLP